MNYYNTTSLKGEELSKAHDQAAIQDRRISELFLKTRLRYTASEVWEKSGMNKENIPLTSIRRSLNTLINRGLLMKSNEKKIGIFGKPESFFLLTPPFAQPQTRLFL